MKTVIQTSAACVAIWYLSMGQVVHAASDIGTFSSVVTIQGPVTQTATGSNVKQDLNVGSAQKSQANSFSSVVTTGSITQTGNNGAQQVINVGGMNSSKADKFDARVTTGNIEQVANRGERQELDIGSVTNSTVTGTATTRVSVGTVKQVGEGEIVLGAVKNSNVQQFQSNLSVQGKIEGNNIRMGSVVGNDRFDNQGRNRGQETIGTGDPNTNSAKLTMPNFSGEIPDNGATNPLTGTGSLAPAPYQKDKEFEFDASVISTPKFLFPYKGVDAYDACPRYQWKTNNNSEFDKYHGPTSVFHCGYEGYVGKYKASDGLFPECFYDENMMLITKYHEKNWCMGSPDEYRASDNKWLHSLFDSGGIAEIDKFRITPVAISGFIESWDERDGLGTNMSKWSEDELKVAIQLLAAGVKFASIKSVVSFYKSSKSGRSIRQALHTTNLAMSSAITKKAITKSAMKDLMFELTLVGYALDQTPINAGRIKFESPNESPWYVDVGYGIADTLSSVSGLSTAHAE